jgi:ribonuclease P protein component
MQRAPGAADRTMRLVIERLKRRDDFLRVASGRQKYATPGLVLQMRQREDIAGTTTPAARVGFTATRKLGSAVVRNRARRRLREAAREVLPVAARPGCDYVLIARSGTLSRPYPALLGDLKTALAALAAKGAHEQRV